MTKSIEKKKIKTYIKTLKRQLDNFDIAKIEQLANIIIDISTAGGTVFVCGNGGSHSTAEHMVCDLGKIVFTGYPFKRIKIMNLGSNSSLVTAVSNDSGYNDIFSDALEIYAKRDDLLIIITGSGNSANIVQAGIAAKKVGIQTYGLLGFDGGKVIEILDDYILCSCDNYGIVEDFHLIINHILTSHLKRKVENRNKNAGK